MESLRKPEVARCEFCGCTDLQSCPGEGCTWLETYRVEGRWVCTSCGGAARELFTDALENYLDPPSPILLPGDPEFEATIMEMRSR